MTITDTGVDYPAKEARKVLRRYGGRGGNIAYPVDPFLIAGRLGVEVSQAKLDNGVAGILIRQDASSPLKAMLNRSDSPQRQRYTLAHELGHVVAHPRDRESIGFVEHRDELGGSTTDRYEAWCNGFADELLTPTDTVRSWWARSRSPEDMALGFDVSFNMIAARLHSLRLI